MTDPLRIVDYIDIDAGQLVEPLPWLDGADLCGTAATPREWMLEGWEPRGSVTYLTGVGASGKSLLAQQRMTCSALGIPFLGIPTRPGVSLYLTCEDDEGELHRRQETINAALGVDAERLRGRLVLQSLKGVIGNELATFDERGRMKPSNRMAQLESLISRTGATHVALDNVAHLFAGNEIIRNQVAAFLGMLEGLAQRINGGVTLIGHPNKSGAEFSGSTAWENQVRSRVFLSNPTSADDGNDPDARLITNSKPNYAQRGQRIDFRWHNWAFVRDADLPTDVRNQLRDSAQAAAENDVFLKCLAKATEEKRPTSTATSASNFAPRVFAKMTIGKGISKDGFERALERLLHLGVIINGQNVYQRDNRAWVTGIGLALTPAPTPHEAAHKPCTEANTVGGENCTDPHALTPLSIDIGGAALGASAPSIENDQDPLTFEELAWGDGQ